MPQTFERLLQEVVRRRLLEKVFYRSAKPGTELVRRALIAVFGCLFGHYRFSAAVRPKTRSSFERARLRAVAAAE